MLGMYKCTVSLQQKLYTENLSNQQFLDLAKVTLAVYIDMCSTFNLSNTFITLAQDLVSHILCI